MATSNIWYLLVDRKNQPLRPPSSVSRLGIEYVVDLKEKVKEKEQLDRPASELEVWRCQNQEMRFVREDVRAHVQEVFFKDQVEYLGEQSEIAELQLKQEILLVRVPAPAPIHLGIDTSIAFNSHRSKSKLSGPNFAEFYDRSDTIKAMASQLLTDRFMLVRGTSGSGKTILMWFLKRYIETHIEGALTEVFMGWEQTPDRLSRRGRSGTLSLNEALTHPEREKIFIFMDDAQDTYSDHTLWNHTLKSVVLKQERFHLVMFASYGSSRQRKSSISAAPPIIPSTHIMGLFPTPYNTLQILFNPEEYQHLINHIDRMVENNQETRMSSVDDDFKEHIYTLTNGHVGAIVTLLTMARSMQKGAASKVSFRDFFNYWNTPRLFFNGLSTNNGSFCRGLPRKDQLTKLNEMERKILKDIVKNDYQGMPASSPTSFPISNVAYKDAVDVLRRRGWLYSYESHDDPERHVLVAASPLHLFWLSYQLAQRSLPDHLKELSLKDFWRQVVALFSSTALAEPCRSGTIPEARYAYEFYRCLHELTDGAFCPSPESAQMPYGRIDFFIEEKRWGIELLRDGDRIIEHGDAQRYEPGGKYNGWFQTDMMKDYVILDFRTKNSGVCRTYPGVERLYQIIFEEDYTSFQIYDHMGNPVGDFVLALRR
ncbi:hypothetical protein VNI00_017692 [Paramarasmius palmivorus]|uniref:AAA+ ATPase domain-containing protein n=1 Tax=Paramarasmius palmivorus TaxID=297713 RepID=A0AAW0B5L5_9AGAR